MRDIPRIIINVLMLVTATGLAIISFMINPLISPSDYIIAALALIFLTGASANFLDAIWGR